MAKPADRRVVVGRIAGIFGIKGWVRVFSYTDPPGKILEYAPWLVGDGEVVRFDVSEGGNHGRGIIAHLQGIDDRDAARELIGALISVPRDRFEKPGPNEFYWSDLLGLQVVTEDGANLGEVADVLETGANDVLVIRGSRRRLVPFIPGAVVRSVDLVHGVIKVAWDVDF